MPAKLSERPGSGEYPDAYALYLRALPEGELLELLSAQLANTSGLLGEVSESDALFRYAPGKWSVKEVIGHVVDVERVFTYRALRFARRDQTPLPGFDQDRWVAAADFDNRSLRSLVEELQQARALSMGLLRGLEPECMLLQGIADGSSFSVRALFWIIAGHERHHLKVLQERYGLSGY